MINVIFIPVAVVIISFITFNYAVSKVKKDGSSENIENTSYEIVEGISYQFVDDGYIILNINDGEYYEFTDHRLIFGLIFNKLSKMILETAQKDFKLCDMNF